ncbi:MAG: hypothetical protein ACR2I6_05205 [Candidatus Planktophila sp.]
MRKIIFSLALSLAFALLATNSALAENELRPTYGGEATFALEVQTEDGSQLALFGTINTIKETVTRMQVEALELQARIEIGDNCRVSTCFKTIVNASTGEQQTLALTEEEIKARETFSQNRLLQVSKVLTAVGDNYTSKLEPVLAIPINAGGSSFTIQGTVSQISKQIQDLKNRVTELQDQVDPCLLTTCYKTIVDIAAGTVETIALSLSDLAQRATDRVNELQRAIAVAQAAENNAGGASQVYQLSVETQNQGFGTSGTRAQLEQVVRDLQERAAQAAANAAAADPCASGGCTAIEVNATTGVTTIRELTASELAMRETMRADEAARSAELAAAAAAALANIP